MNPAKHVAASALTSTAFFSMTHSWPGTIACFLSGIVIDVDHLFDFYIHHKRMCWSLSEMYDFCLKDKAGKMYMVFHTYELLVLLWIAVALLKFDTVLLGMAVGLSIHMMFDQMINPVYPLAYFWFFRWRFGFSKKIFFHEDFLEEQKITLKPQP